MKQVLRSRRLRTGRSDFTLLASATDSNGTECQCTKTGQAGVARFGDGWRTIIWICCGERSGSSRFVEDGGQPRNCTTQSTKLHLDPADLVSAYQVRKGGSLGCGHGGIDSEKRQNRSDCVTVRNERHGSVRRIASGVDCVARGGPGSASVRQRPRLCRMSCPSSTWWQQNRRRTCAVWHFVWMGETTCQLAR